MFQLHRIAAVVAIGLVAAAPAWGGSSSQDHPATSRFPAPSALERALQAKDSHPATSVFTAPYALERALQANSESHPATSTFASSYALERALQSDGEDALGRALRIGAASLPQPTADVGSAAATGGERLIRWPQVGIGVGVGLLLAFGAVVLVRFARSRPLPS
jgi:hypothetical protein